MGKKDEVPKPEGFDTHPLVVCIDGPKAASWYFEDYGSGSWAEQVRLAALGQTPRSTILGYVDSGKSVPHPRWPEVSGKALVWRPEQQGGGASGSNP